MKIKRNDMVVVITGNYAGPTPRKVVSVESGGDKVIVEGVNRVFKHVKKGHPRSPQGGRLEIELPIHASNVKYYCESCNQGTRLGYRYTDDGAKERFCRKCGASAGVISPAKQRYAKS